MNVFVLSTGRCGSMTIARAFAHASNLTAGHETGFGSFYWFGYPDAHVESDNRLSWMLGPLADRYPDARYIHLIRDRDETARSFAARPYDTHSLLHAFGAGILGRGALFREERYETARRLWDVVNGNITSFLANRPHRVVWLPDLAEQLPHLWRFVGAKGDLKGAVAEAAVRHNVGASA